MEHPNEKLYTVQLTNEEISDIIKDIEDSIKWAERVLRDPPAFEYTRLYYTEIRMAINRRICLQKKLIDAVGEVNDGKPRSEETCD